MRWLNKFRALFRKEQVEHERRITHYKAPAHACNACHIKANCTDSKTGREIERRIDSWLTSEIRRFHHGISLALLTLAALLLAIGAARYHELRSELVLGLLFTPDRHSNRKAALLIPQPR